MRRLLLEGGVAGHLSHLYDNRSLTLSKIKKILVAASSGELVGTEKTDGYNIYLGYVNGEARSARNKTHMRQGGINAQELAMREFKGGEKVRRAYVESFDAYEAAIASLTPEERQKIFGPNGEIFYNTEIMGPGASNVVNYDANVVGIHRGGHKMYDRATDKVVDIDATENSITLDNVINKFEMATSGKNFSVQRTAMLKLKSLDSDADVRIAIAKIERVGLSGNKTIEQYLEEKLHEDIESNLKYLNDHTKQDIVDKILRKENAKNLRDIYKEYPVEQKDIIRKYVKNGGAIVSKAIFPIEDAVHDFTVEMLRGLESAYILDNAKEVERLRREINTAISNIKQYTGPGAEEAHSVLAKQLQKIKHHDNINTAVEGFVFQSPLPGEQGQMYKFTGNFAPINQILGLFKYGRGSVPAIKRSGESEQLQEAEGGQTVAIVPGAFKPPHRGHLDMVKHYSDIADKVIVYVSPLDRGGITAQQSIAIWGVYIKASGLNNVEIRKSGQNSPVRASIDYVAEGGPAGHGEKVILGVSTKGGDQERFAGNVRKYADPSKDLEILDPIRYAFEPYGEELSASDFREALKNAKDQLSRFMPAEVIRGNMAGDVVAALGVSLQEEQPIDAETLYEMISNIMDETGLLSEAVDMKKIAKQKAKSGKLKDKLAKIDAKRQKIMKKVQKFDKLKWKLGQKIMDMEEDIVDNELEYSEEQEEQAAEEAAAKEEEGGGEDMEAAAEEAAETAATAAGEQVTAAGEEATEAAAEEMKAEKEAAAEESATEMKGAAEDAAAEHEEKITTAGEEDDEKRKEAYAAASKDAGLAEMSAMGGGAVAGFAGPIGDDEEEEEKSAAIRRSPLINEEKDVIVNTILNRLINSLNAN
jgi:cytidyltransferase-like protein